MNEKTKIFINIFIYVLIVAAIFFAGFIVNEFWNRSKFREINKQIGIIENENSELRNQIEISGKRIIDAERTAAELGKNIARLTETVRRLRDENKNSNESIIRIIGSIEESIGITESITGIIDEIITGFKQIKKAVGY